MSHAVSIQSLMQARNEAQRAVEIFLATYYPIDTKEKAAQLQALTRAAADAEYELRQFLRSAPSSGRSA